ncbi:hypothetical protein ACFS7Z_18720 [Pontibacter toksunensis]|uniref:Uncharacterized protein n=1 Tax=Pontibacter toksunensis TaxID=1332631 RepID=A0ABW6BZL5_9BACT
MKQKNLPQPTSAADNTSAEMKAYWQTIRNTDHSNSFSKTSHWVRHREHPATVSHSIPEKMHVRLAGLKFRMAYIVLALLLVVGACNYPVEVKEPLATVLRWEVKADDKAAVNAMKQISWLQQGPLLVEEINLNGNSYLAYSITVPDADPAVLQSYRNSLAGIKGVSGLTVSPVTHTRSQPLYAAALESFFKIEMDATGISNEALEKSIQEQLQAQGIHNLAVKVTTGQDGERKINTSITDEAGEAFGVDLKVKDGKRVTHVQEQIKYLQPGEVPPAKDMTDAEIKAFVIKKNPHLSLKEDEIVITRKPGKTEVTVQGRTGVKMNLLFK